MDNMQPGGREYRRAKREAMLLAKRWMRYDTWARSIQAPDGEEPTAWQGWNAACNQSDLELARMASVLHHLVYVSLPKLLPLNREQMSALRMAQRLCREHGADAEIDFSQYLNKE